MQDAHNGYDITDFHGALLDIISVMNQPVRDEQILQAAGVKLEQMLFPLLVAVGRYGPVGVVELADHLGRDYTTCLLYTSRNNAALSSRRLSRICHLVPSSLDFAFCGLKSVRLALLPLPLAASAKLLPPGGCCEMA